MQWADGSSRRTSTEGSPMRRLPALAGTDRLGAGTVPDDDDFNPAAHSYRTHDKIWRYR